MSAQPFILSFYLKSHAVSAVQNWCLRMCKNCHLWSMRKRTNKMRRMLHSFTALILLEMAWQILMDIWWQPAWGLYMDIWWQPGWGLHVDLWWEPGWGLYMDIGWEPAWGLQVDIWWGSCSSVMLCCWERAFGKLCPPRQNVSNDPIPLVPTAPSHPHANAPSCSGKVKLKASFEVLNLFIHLLSRYGSPGCVGIIRGLLGLFS